MTDTFTIYGYDDNPRTRIVRIVAAAEDITLITSEVVPRMGINKAAYVERFPLSQGKIPAIEGPGIKLTETIAIATYFARLHGRARLLGSTGTPEQEARVLSYVSFANQELIGLLARWFLPLVPGFSDPAPYDRAAVEQGKAASLAAFARLERVLAEDAGMGKDGSGWLVGNGPTLADVFMAVVVSRGLQWVLDRVWRERHPAIIAHFERVRAWEPVRRVIPDFVLIEEETPNADPNAPEAGQT